MMDWWPVVQIHHIMTGHPFQEQMPPAGRDQRQARLDDVSVASLPNFHRADLIRAGRRMPWRSKPECVARWQIPGRSPRNEVRTDFKRLRVRRSRRRAKMILRARRRKISARSNAEFGPWGFRAAERRQDHCVVFLRRARARGRHGGGGPDLFGQNSAVGVSAIRAARFVHDINRSGLKGFQRFVRTARGQRTHDDHRHGTVFHNELEEADAVHARHLNIERDHLGRQRQDFVARHIRVHRRANHFDVGKRGEAVGDDLASQRRIIHHQKADGLLGAHDWYFDACKPVALFARAVPVSRINRFSISLREADFQDLQRLGLRSGTAKESITLALDQRQWAMMSSQVNISGQFLVVGPAWAGIVVMPDGLAGQILRENSIAPAVARRFRRGPLLKNGFPLSASRKEHGPRARFR